MSYIHLALCAAFAELRAECLQLAVAPGCGSIQQEIERVYLRRGVHRAGSIDLRNRLLDARQHIVAFQTFRLECTGVIQSGGRLPDDQRRRCIGPVREGKDAEVVFPE